MICSSVKWRIFLQGPAVQPTAGGKPESVLHGVQVLKSRALDSQRICCCAGTSRDCGMNLPAVLKVHCVDLPLIFTLAW